jgi:hypothetical protein
MIPPNVFQKIISLLIWGMDLANIWKEVNKENILVRFILNLGIRKPHVSVMVRLKVVLIVNVEWEDIF